jgi:hypothetical protein
MKTNEPWTGVALTTTRVLAAFVAYAVLMAATGGLFAPSGAWAQPSRESLQALPLGALASSVVLSYLILRSRWAGARLALAVGAALFVAHTVLPSLQSLAGAQLSAPVQARALATAWFAGAVFAGLWAPAAVALLGRASSSGTAPLDRQVASSAAEWCCKLAGGVLLYAVAHLGPDCWATRPWAVLLAGSLWTLVGVTIARMSRGSALELSLAVGGFFAVTAGCIELPSAHASGQWFAPAPLREVATSFLLGALLGAGLSWRGPRRLTASLADRLV